MFSGSNSQRKEVWCNHRPFVKACALPPNCHGAQTVADLPQGAEEFSMKWKPNKSIVSGHVHVLQRWRCGLVLSSCYAAKRVTSTWTAANPTRTKPQFRSCLAVKPPSTVLHTKPTTRERTSNPRRYKAFLLQNVGRLPQRRSAMIGHTTSPKNNYERQIQSQDAHVSITTMYF